MARTLYTAPIPPLDVTAGSAYNTSVTLTDVSPTPPVVLPANLLDVGQVLRICAFGTFSTTATPTLLLGFYYGGVAGVALAATGATTTGTATNWPWRLEWEGRIRSTGTAGTIMGSGWLNLATSLTAYSQIPIPATALATVTIDTTTAKALTVGAQWGTSSASNTLTCHHHSVELIG